MCGTLPSAQSMPWPRRMQQEPFSRCQRYQCLGYMLTHVARLVRKSLQWCIRWRQIWVVCAEGAGSLHGEEGCAGAMVLPAGTSAARLPSCMTLQWRLTTPLMVLGWIILYTMQVCLTVLSSHFPPILQHQPVTPACKRSTMCNVRGAAHHAAVGDDPCEGLQPLSSHRVGAAAELAPCDACRGPASTLP